MCQCKLETLGRATYSHMMKILVECLEDVQKEFFATGKAKWKKQNHCSGREQKEIMVKLKGQQ